MRSNMLGIISIFATALVVPNSEYLFFISSSYTYESLKEVTTADSAKSASWKWIITAHGLAIVLDFIIISSSWVWLYGLL